MKPIFGKEIGPSRLILPAFLSALLSSAAMAQISNISTDQGAHLKIGGVQQILSNPVSSPNYMSQSGSLHGAGYAAFTDIADNKIYFEAGSMSSGKGNASRSVVEVSFDVLNTDASQSIDRLQSTIFESTFGFHVADFFAPYVNNGTLIEGCQGAVLPSCGIATSGLGLGGFTNISDPAQKKQVAYTSFKFEVLQDGQSMKDISGSLMLLNDNGVFSFAEGSGNASLSGELIDFELAENSNYAYIFGWGRTNFTADLLDPLGLNESSTFTYRITTETWSEATALGQASTNMIISFACFIDPLGRGGGTSYAAILPLGNPSDDTCDDFGQLGQDSSKVYALGIPRIKDGMIIFTSGIPEAKSWAMLIAGFGLVGLSMRRRRSFLPSSS